MNDQLLVLKTDDACFVYIDHLPYTLNTLVKQCKGYRWSSLRKRWEWPLCDETHTRLTRLLSSRAKTTLTIDQSVVNAVTDNDSPSVLPSLCVKANLYSYQAAGVDFLAQRRRAGLWDQMGLGKTIQSLAIMAARIVSGQTQACLVLCPKSATDATWDRQIKQFTNVPTMLVSGTRDKRRGFYERIRGGFSGFVIMGWETFRVDHETMTQMGIINTGNQPVNAIILDEAHKMKSRKAHISKALYNSSFRYVASLTGTPVANQPEDLWSLWYYLAPADAGTFWDYSDEYLVKIQLPRINVIKTVGVKNEKLLWAKLGNCVLRRLKSEVGNQLPPKVYSCRMVELEDPEQKAAYQHMKRDLIATISQTSDNDFSVIADSVLTQMLRLTQICDGFLAEGNNAHFFKTASKIDEVLDIVEEQVANHQKTVVWVRWIPLLHKLVDTCRERGYSTGRLFGAMGPEDRKTTIHEFQYGETQVFVGQVVTGGTSIDLYAADTEIFVDKAFLSPAVVEQAEDRLHRIGQTRSVNVIDIAARGTIDQHWVNLFDTKQEISRLVIGDEVRMSRANALRLLQDDPRTGV